ncbi:DNA polymerase Y family protein [Mycetocola zhujimingii]|uniref:DNA polymerase Y family protein n=1 Tax=Mycetocola zhujimingii TaxID=2079792 RepID=UPI000D3AD278|nr:DNA polymerase Y family protein [Mycetocola zhujimingii]AWB87083.1 DNA polymerase [Mycetocola zhujimingii]
MTAAPIRTILLWCPDWPTNAAAIEHGFGADVPLALIDRGEVFACSAAARSEGVRRGLRVREAQSRSTGLIALPYDPVLDHRAFEPVIAAVEQIVPGVQLSRPGTCVMRARGPSRYYGGERQAAQALLDTLNAVGVRDARVGIADGPFAAGQAAKLPSSRETDAIRIVPAGRSPEFLAAFGVDILERPELAVLLQRLGIRTLGDFAALDAMQVRDRFGPDGILAHRLASGFDPSDVDARVPPADHSSVVEFEPPLDRVDQVAFAFRAAAEEFVSRLQVSSLVATAIRIEVRTEGGDVRSRTWLHPRWFTAGDVLDRVRWQLQGAGMADSGLSSAISSLRVEAESVDPAGNHEAGLYGGATDERIHSGLSRVQGMVGHAGVLTARIAGGRQPSDRRVLVPWGDLPPGGEASVRASQELPWPGKLPGPPPATVFPERQRVVVQAADGHDIGVDERGELSAVPVGFAPHGQAAVAVSAWTGPWPVAERWWDGGGTRLNRFQLVDDTGAAWLLVLDDSGWWAEARYD